MCFYLSPHWYVWYVFISVSFSLSLALLLILLCRVPVNVGVILHILPLRSTNTFGGFYLFTAVLCFVWVLLRFAFDCIISLCVRSFHFGLVWYACANFVCVNGTLFSDLKRRTAPISSKISKISDIVCMHVWLCEANANRRVCVRSFDVCLSNHQKVFLYYIFLHYSSPWNWWSFSPLFGLLGKNVLPWKDKGKWNKTKQQQPRGKERRNRICNKRF